MSKEAEKSNERISSLERDVENLTEKMDEIEQTEKIKKILKDQEKGAFKYLLDTLKVIAAIIFLLTAGNKAVDGNEWIKNLVK